MKRRLALAAMLALGGCGSQPAAPPAATASPTPVASPYPDAKHQLAAAVRAAFPKGNLVSFDDQPARQYDEHRLVDTPFGPVLVSSGFMPDASHAPGGMIAIHYLVERDGGFALRPGYPKTYETGSFGRLGEWSVSDRFGDLPMVYAEGGGTFQGYTCARAKLIELRPEGPAEVADIPTVYDNAGAVEQGGEAIEGKIAGIVKGKGFTVRYTGSRRFEERYLRVGNRFELQGGPSRMPSC
ncbi:MAG: hypothetical protein V4574_04475 [Pseudomonadota bacterium]